MTVGELRSKLEGVEDHVLLVLSRDEEGNGFLPLEAISWGYYVEAYGEGTFLPSDASYEDNEIGEYGERVALALWP